MMMMMMCVFERERGREDRFVLSCNAGCYGQQELALRHAWVLLPYNLGNNDVSIHRIVKQNNVCIY
jgi:hypothetical protein